jgi:hypothetical protein
MKKINIFTVFTIILAISTLGAKAEENQEIAKNIEKVRATSEVQGEHVGCSWYDGRGCKAE